MSVDRETQAFYQREAPTYAEWTKKHAVSKRLAHFADALPVGGDVLDLGCGAGWAALWLRDRGFRVAALDPTQALLDLLREESLELIHAGAADLDRANAFDGIWSNCALQHLPRSELPEAIRRIGHALRPGGHLALALHEGEETLRDRLGRLYCHWPEAALTGLLAQHGMTVTRVSRVSDNGYDGRPITIIRLDAIKDA